MAAATWGVSRIRLNEPETYSSSNVVKSLIVSLVHFMVKHFCHQDTKTQIYIFAKGFPLCLGAFVAIWSGLAG